MFDALSTWGLGALTQCVVRNGPQLSQSNHQVLKHSKFVICNNFSGMLAIVLFGVLANVFNITNRLEESENEMIQ